MTYFWSLYLNFNFCLKCPLLPEPVTYIYMEYSLISTCALSPNIKKKLYTKTWVFFASLPITLISLEPLATRTWLTMPEITYSVDKKSWLRRILRHWVCQQLRESAHAHFGHFVSRIIYNKETHNMQMFCIAFFNFFNFIFYIFMRWSFRTNCNEKQKLSGKRNVLN